MLADLAGIMNFVNGSQRSWAMRALAFVVSLNSLASLPLKRRLRAFDQWVIAAARTCQVEGAGCQELLAELRADVVIVFEHGGTVFPSLTLLDEPR